MKIEALISKSRSYRRFDQNQRIPGETLHALVKLARFSPSGMNLQPLKFWLSNTEDMNQRIFPHVGWAGALKDWGGPVDGERPSAYIIILGDTQIRESFGVDHGIAAQSIMLGAAEKGLGGCILGSAKKDALRADLGILERFEILLVLALGVPAETVVTEDVGADGDVTYYRDENDVHHVPKRGLDELILHDV
ncbi:MAG: nitroreductase family protein [Brevefilum sp.]